MIAERVSERESASEKPVGSKTGVRRERNMIQSGFPADTHLFKIIIII